MNRIYSNRLHRAAVVGLALVAVLAASMALTPSPAPARKPMPPRGGTAARVFKNIQVLKTLPANQLLPTMHLWSASLGVNCEFCHVIGANHQGFEKDTKPEKGIARKMYTMAVNINHQFQVVGKQVTCYTCHHGHALPESHPEERPMGRM